MNRRTRPEIRRSGRLSAAPRGFTLVELLVVIAIIAMLTALLVPAVQYAREAARRATCLNNQKQIGSAVMQFATAKDRLPYGFSVHPNPSGSLANPACLGWVIPLLPYLEQKPLYDQLMADDRLINNLNATGANLRPETGVLVCPSRSPTDTPAPLSYVVNAGARDGFSNPTASSEPLDFQASGVFFDHYLPDVLQADGTWTSQEAAIARMKTDLAYITRNDGTAHTALVSENIDALDWVGKYRTYGSTVYYTPNDQVNMLSNQGSTWWQGMIWFTNPMDPNWNPKNILNRNTDLPMSQRQDRQTNLPPTAKPSSSHPGGFIMTMVDGHSVFVNEDVEYRVYCLVMSPHSEEAADPWLGNAKKTALYPSTWYAGTMLKPVTEADLTE